MIRILLFSAFVITFQHGISPVSFAVDFTEQNEKYRIVDELIVNSRNKFKTVIFQNEDKGISDMRKLVESSRIEESWAYIPHLEKWIEVGYNEESERKLKESYIIKARLDLHLLDLLMDKNSNIVLYHFHPSSHYSLEEKIKKQEEKGSSMNINEIEKERIWLLIQSAYPSRSDLMNMIGNSTEFYERNPEGRITFKICSHFGITEYHLTDEGLIHLYADNSPGQTVKIKDKSLSSSIEANVTGEILESSPWKTRNPLKRIKMNPRQKREPLSRYIIIDPLSRIEKAIGSMNDGYIKVAFTPYK